MDAKSKRPFAIALNGGEPFAFAGLWESWRPKDGESLETFTILTTSENELMRPIHDRMPVILEPRDYDRWLDAGDPARPPVDLLRPYPAEKMLAWPVSDRVGNVRKQRSCAAGAFGLSVAHGGWAAILRRELPGRVALECTRTSSAIAGPRRVHLHSGGSMADGKISSLPISEIHSEAGAQELVHSERMKPYLAYLKAQMGGQDTEPYLAALAALPLEERYVWRVISALKWAFCDLDTENAIADVRTLSEEDLKKVVEPLSLRAIQFCLFVNALIGEDATERIMEHALRCAKESSMPASGE